MGEFRQASRGEIGTMGRRGAWGEVAALGWAAGLWLMPLAMADDAPNPAPPPIADGPPGFRDIWEKSQPLRAKSSLDTSPVLIDVFGTKYNIPRNFLVYLPSELTYATLKVTLPGFKPLTDETRPCFEHRQADCEPLEVVIGSGYVSQRVAFEREFRHFINKEPRQSSDGYDEYDIGPDNARIENYTRTIGDELVYFTCLVDKTEPGWSAKSICDDHFFYNKTPLHFSSLESGLTLSLRLRREYAT
jgi:hypothetical protein